MSDPAEYPTPAGSDLDGSHEAAAPQPDASSADDLHELVDTLLDEIEHTADQADQPETTLNNDDDAALEAHTAADVSLEAEPSPAPEPPATPTEQPDDAHVPPVAPAPSEAATANTDTGFSAEELSEETTEEISNETAAIETQADVASPQAHAETTAEQPEDAHDVDTTPATAEEDEEEAQEQDAENTEEQLESAIDEALDKASPPDEPSVEQAQPIDVTDDDVENATSTLEQDETNEEVASLDAAIAQAAEEALAADQHGTVEPPLDQPDALADPTPSAELTPDPDTLQTTADTASEHEEQPDLDAPPTEEASDERTEDTNEDEFESAVDEALDEASTPDEPAAQHAQASADEDDGFEDVASILGEDHEQEQDNDQLASLDTTIAQAAQEAISIEQEDHEPPSDEAHEPAEPETVAEESIEPASQSTNEPAPAPSQNAQPIPAGAQTAATATHSWHKRVRVCIAHLWRTVWLRTYPATSLGLAFLTAWSRSMPPSTRQTIMYIGFVTAFNAACLWGWILLRQPEQPTATIQEHELPRVLTESPSSASAIPTRQPDSF